MLTTAVEPTEDESPSYRSWLLPLYAVLMLGGFLFSMMTTPDNDKANYPEYGNHSVCAQEGVVYRFAVHPLYNPRRLFSVFIRMMDKINSQACGFKVRLVASRNYQSFEARTRKNDFEITLSNPSQALQAVKHGYRIIGKMGDDSQFCGIIFARRDSGITDITDLKGKVLAFPSPTALAATMMPLYYLHNRGLDIKDTDMHFVGSQESVIMNVVLGNADVGATWPMPWQLLMRERPEFNNILKILWKTPPLVNNAILVRDDMPEKDARIIMDALVDLVNSPDGREILHELTLSRFERCTVSAYQPVVTFLKDYISTFPKELSVLQP